MIDDTLIVILVMKISNYITKRSIYIEMTSIFKGKQISSGTGFPHGMETSPCGQADKPTIRSISAYKSM